MEPESNALNPLNGPPSKDLERLSPKKLPNHREMKAPILKKNVNNKNPFGKVVSFRNIAGPRNRKRDPEQPACFLKILGRNRKMIEVFQQITDVAEYDYPIHIYGETGTGKELVAGAIHKTSSRKNKPFVPINCGALPESIVESELFGHVKGSFSGAVRDRVGRFELADGGTIFFG